MSKDAGDIFEALVINARYEPASIELIIDVTNDEERTIYVPCGTIKGKSSEVIIAGAHHDTVYQGEGAVDDTSGVATVLEMARQLLISLTKPDNPKGLSDSAHGVVKRKVCGAVEHMSLICKIV